MSHRVLNAEQFANTPVLTNERSLTDPTLLPEIPEKEDEDIGPEYRRPFPA